MTNVFKNSALCFSLTMSLILAVQSSHAEQRLCNPDTGAFCLPDALKGKTIRFCSDSSEWPPFTYFKRDSSANIIEDQVEGFNVELVDHIFKDLDINHQFSLVPWKRCMQQGLVNGDFDVVLDASLNKERVENYLMTISHYSLNLSFFYSLKKYPVKIKLSSLDDLKKIDGICGLAGYSYTALGDFNKNIDKGANNISALLQRTLLNRCNAFIARKEIFEGLTMLGPELKKMSEDIASNKIPGIEKENFYMLISKNFPHHYELKYVLDFGVIRLRNEGTYNTLLNKHLQQ